MLDNYNIQSDDLITVIRICIQDMLYNFKTFSGKVISVDDDGIATVWSKQFNGSELSETTKHITVKPATKFYNSIYPKKNDNILFYFIDGQSDARYFAIDSNTTQKLSIEGKEKYIIFALSSTKYLMYDNDSSEFIFKNGLSEISFSDSKAEFNFSGIKTTIDSSGVSTNGNISDSTGSLNSLRQEVEQMKQTYNTHVHNTTGLPTSPTATPNNQM